MRKSQKPLNPITRVILCGLNDKNNVWYKLGGMPYIVNKILESVFAYNKIYFKEFILNRKIIQRNYKRNISDTNELLLDKIENVYDNVFYHEMEKLLEFPEPNNVSINMMPFKMITDSFESSKLPDYLHGYWDIIKYCINNDKSQYGKIGYLTIQESYIEPNKTHRRSGIHVETPGTMRLYKSNDSVYCNVGDGGIATVNHVYFNSNIFWGRGGS